MINKCVSIDTLFMFDIIYDIITIITAITAKGEFKCYVNIAFNSYERVRQMASILAVIRRHFVRFIINIVFLASSCYFSVNFIIVLLQKALHEWIVAIFAIFVEIYFQYSLYVAEKRKQEGKRWAARGLKLQYFMIYVLIYCHLSGLGFFLTEIQTTRKVLQRQTFIELADMDRIKQIDRELETLDLHLQTESRTGYGRQSKEVEKRKEKLEAERAEILKKLSEVSQAEQDAATVKNSFQGLAEAFGISENLLQLIVFETILLIIYIGLYVTRWKPDWRPEKKVKPARKSSKTSPTKKVSQKIPESPSILSKTSSQSSQGYEGSLEQDKVRHFEDEEFERFVRVSIRESGILNSPQRVSMLTGIPLAQCITYRKLLNTMTIDGQLVVETAQGGSRTLVDKETILRYIRQKKEGGIA